MTALGPGLPTNEQRRQPPQSTMPTRRGSASLRSLLFATFCTLALALAASGCGTTRADESTATTAAGASGSPTPASSTPSDTATPAQDAAPCQAANLTAAPVTATPMGMTQTAYRVRLINKGPECRLRGYPQHLTGLDLTGKTHRVPTHSPTQDEIASLTSGKPAGLLASGDMAEFVLHTAQGCESDRVGPSKAESYTRLWFSPPSQPGKVAVVPGKPVDAGPSVIALSRCNTSVTRFYAALPRTTPSTSPTPAGDPTGILDDREAPAPRAVFMPGNRWHGTIGGQDVNVYAGSVGNTRMGTGKVIVELGLPGAPGSQTLSVLTPHTGPLMIVAAPYPARLTLWDSHGYRHTLILLAGAKTMEHKQRGRRVAVPADAVMPAAGVCGGALHHLVTVGVGAGAAYPRCVQVFADEALRVENRSDDQPPRTSVTVGFPTLPATTVGPGESLVFAHPFTRLAPGVHTITLGMYTADIWVR